MLIKVCSVAHCGLQAQKVDVEINVAERGLPAFDIVGLPSKAVAESKERVRTAIVNAGMEFPAKRVTVNLAPADLPKEGSCYDLPIAIGILALVMGFKLPAESLFFGELSLDGSLRHTKGVLLLSLFARQERMKKVFVPFASANEAAVVGDVRVCGPRTLSELVDYFLGYVDLPPVRYKSGSSVSQSADFDMNEVLGQEQAKRALEIAACGGHNVFMVGSPGAGKTMLARALPGILPQLSDAESLEVTKIYSVGGHIPPCGSLIKIRPFRAPHHSISQVGLIGGGTRPQPGEVSLSHRGVLFLDEFNEFPRSVIESLRQPLEDGTLTISRSRERVSYPCRFMLVASANPCPCGYLRHPQRSCVCGAREVEKYRKRISGPILDRIDICVDVPVVKAESLSVSDEALAASESSSSLKERVEAVRRAQGERFASEVISTNAEMKNAHIRKYCGLSKAARTLLVQATRAFQLSARSHFKMIKVGRTIADLEGDANVKERHIAEALQYRPKMGE